MKKKWTIIIFMAADNDLESFAAKNIHAMERIGSTDKVDIIVQIDRGGGGPDGTALRGKIEKNSAWEEFKIERISRLEDIGETNTGDPKVLSNFIEYAVCDFPADNYGLIIWGHGSGWREDFIYEAAKKSISAEIVDAIRAVNFAGLYAYKTKRIIFRNTLNGMIDRFIHTSLLPNLKEDFDIEIKSTISNCVSLNTNDRIDVVMRAIALDTTSRDALDTIELNKALRDAADAISKLHGKAFRYAFIGFDACLMAGIEVCFEIRDLTNLIIGSEEIEPGVGWPYDRLIESISKAVASNSDTAINISKSLVDNYIDSLSEYKIRLVTQSAILTSEFESLVKQIDTLAVLLKNAIDSQYKKLAQSEKRATKFYDKDFIDIESYLDQILSADISGEINHVVRNIKDSYSRTVITSKFAFAFNNEQPTGLSLYYPSKEVFDKEYERLSLHKVFNNWIDFIKRYHFIN